MTTLHRPVERVPTTSKTARPNDRSLRDRPRRAGLLALAALLIVGSAVAGAVVVSRAGDREEVVAVNRPVARGQQITRDDLILKRVAGIETTFAADEVNTVVGATTAVDLVPGQIVTRPTITREPVPGEGQSIVGLDLDPSRVPSSGLEPGVFVSVIAVAAGDGQAAPDDLDAPPVLASDARVLDVAGDPTDGGGTAVTLLVDSESSARVAAYSTSKRVALIVTPPPDESGASQ